MPVNAVDRPTPRPLPERSAGNRFIPHAKLAAFQVAVVALLALFFAGAIPGMPYWDPDTDLLPSHTHSYAHYDEPRALMIMADQSVRRAEATEDLTERRALATQARALALDSLSKRPLNPYAWIIYAQGSMLVEDHEEALRGIRLSLERGPYERGMVVARLAIAIRLWDRMEDAEHDVHLKQMRWAWKVEPQKLTRLALTSLTHEVLIRVALGTDEKAHQDLSRAITRLRATI